MVGDATVALARGALATAASETKIMADAIKKVFLIVQLPRSRKGTNIVVLLNTFFPRLS